jgi:hypothetical protein
MIVSHLGGSRYMLLAGMRLTLWNEQVTDPGITRFPMELHTEEGVISGVPEARLNDPRKERGVKKLFPQ